VEDLDATRRYERLGYYRQRLREEAGVVTIPFVQCVDRFPIKNRRKARIRFDGNTDLFCYSLVNIGKISCDNADGRRCMQPYGCPDVFKEALKPDMYGNTTNSKMLLLSLTR